MRFQTKLLAAAALSAAVFATPASAALSVADIYTGTYGLSTDGGGSNLGSYMVSAFVPAGATVTAAYLYQSTYGGATYNSITLDGNSLTFGPASINTSNGLRSSRVDVTSFLAPVINGGVGGTYNFTIDEGANINSIDGTALVVVYSLPSLATSTVAILDGFTAPGGDTTTLSFSSPLNPLAPGFTAEMRLGIGFSCCGQQSTVKVNGTTITNTAGNNDDGLGSTANGQLITVGGDDDAFSTLLPAYGDDHERYSLVPYINVGDTAITVDTNNPSGDDNIFLAAFRVSGNAVVNAVPEPGTWTMMIAGFGMVGAFMRRRVRKLAAMAA
jgi:PEP-CTERM motif